MLHRIEYGNHRLTSSRARFAFRPRSLRGAETRNTPVLRAPSPFAAQPFLAQLSRRSPPACSLLPRDRRLPSGGSRFSSPRPNVSHSILRQPPAYKSWPFWRVVAAGGHTSGSPASTSASDGHGRRAAPPTSLVQWRSSGPGQSRSRLLLYDFFTAACHHAPRGLTLRGRPDMAGRIVESAGLRPGPRGVSRATPTSASSPWPSIHGFTIRSRRCGRSAAPRRRRSRAASSPSWPGGNTHRPHRRRRHPPPMSPPASPSRRTYDAEFWASSRARLRFQRCDGPSGRFRHYPRPTCPRCLSREFHVEPLHLPAVGLHLTMRPRPHAPRLRDDAP